MLMRSLKSDLRLLKFIGWNTARGWDCVPWIGASGDQSPLSPIQRICVPGSSWLLLRLGLPTVQPLLLSLKGHSLRIYLQTVTIFTGLLSLIEDVLGKKKRLLQPFSPFIRFGVQHTSLVYTPFPRFSRGVPCEPHGPGWEGRVNNATDSSYVLRLRFSITMGIFDWAYTMTTKTGDLKYGFRVK